VQGKVDGRSMGEVRDDHGICAMLKLARQMDMTLVWRTRNTTMFVENDKISNIVSTTSIRQLFYNVVSSIDPM